MAINTLELADDHATSAEIVACIEDLLTEILLRLPTRAVTRFRLVSRHWNSLIVNPEFWKMRTKKPDPATGLFLLLPYKFSHRVTHLSFYADKSTIPTLIGANANILQSCNGLLLCSTALPMTDMCSDYYIYNPTTKSSSKLPELVCEPEHLVTRICSMSLAFDPSISSSYKVICILIKEDELSYFYIYSSDTGLWTESLTEVYTLISGSGVYWNGAIHWMSAESYFNIETQALKQMPVPPIGGWKHNYYFGESYGHLYYTKLRFLKTGSIIHVYEMRSDYSGWFVKYSVDLLGQLIIRSVLSVVRGVKEDDSFLILQSQWAELRYNLVSGTIDKLEGQEFIGTICKRAFQYIECLQDV